MEELTIKEKIALATNKWSEKFHGKMYGILAPKGFKKSGEYKVSLLGFLTEERVKKTANLAHEVLKSYKRALLESILKEYVSLVAERDHVTERLNLELSRSWVFRDKRIIRAYREQLLDISNQLKWMNGIEAAVHTVQPMQDLDDEIKEFKDKFKVNEPLESVPQNNPQLKINRDEQESPQTN